MIYGGLTSLGQGAILAADAAAGLPPAATNGHQAAPAGIPVPA